MQCGHNIIDVRMEKLRAVRALGCGGSLAAGFAVVVGIGVWFDAIQVTTVPALPTSVTWVAVGLMFIGLLGALTAIENAQLGAVLMLIAAVGSVVAGATDILVVGQPSGFHGVGALLIIGAALWLAGAFVAIRVSRQPPAGERSTTPKRPDTP